MFARSSSIFLRAAKFSSSALSRVSDWVHTARASNSGAFVSVWFFSITSAMALAATFSACHRTRVLRVLFGPSPVKAHEAPRGHFWPPDGRPCVSHLTANRVGIEDDIIGVKVGLADRPPSFNRFGHMSTFLLAQACHLGCDGGERSDRNARQMSARKTGGIITGPRRGSDWKASRCPRFPLRPGHRLS